MVLVKLFSILANLHARWRHHGAGRAAAAAKTPPRYATWRTARLVRRALPLSSITCLARTSPSTILRHRPPVNPVFTRYLLTRRRGADTAHTQMGRPTYEAPTREYTHRHTQTQTNTQRGPTKYGADSRRGRAPSSSEEGASPPPPDKIRYDCWVSRRYTTHDASLI